MIGIEKLTIEEFCARFKARMLYLTSHLDDKTYTAQYADKMAPTYFDGIYHREGESPEDCAESDMSSWE